MTKTTMPSMLVEILTTFILVTFIWQRTWQWSFYIWADSSRAAEHKKNKKQNKTNQPDCERPDGTSMPQQSSETEYLGHWINQMKAVTKKKEVIQIWNS